MPDWAEIISKQKGGPLSRLDRQTHRAMAVDYERKKLIGSIVRSYWLWVIGAVPAGIAVARFFLDHSGSK